MDSDMASMLKAILENQERWMAWDPTSHHGFESSSTYQGGLMDENFAQGNQCGYGERYQSWDMEHDQGATYSSKISNEEENLNMMKLILEGQEKYNESIHMLDFTIGSPTPCSRVAATTHVESINTKLTQWNEEQEENARIEDEFLQEAEKVVEEFELLFGCTVDEDLMIRYEEQVDPMTLMSDSTKSNEERVGEVERTFEDPCESGLVVECIENASESSIVKKELSTKEETHVQPIAKKEKRDSHIEEASKEGEEEESPMAQPFAKYLGLISTNEESIDDPWKLPFEEVRMQQFRGWFYDEYDPGDRSFNVELET